MSTFIRPVSTDQITRKREDHNTAALYVLPHLSNADLIECSEIWTAPTDGVGNQKAGDRWGKVAKINGVAPTDAAGALRSLWVALEHNHEVISMEEDPQTPPGPESPFVAAHLERADGTMVHFDLIEKP